MSKKLVDALGIESFNKVKNEILTDEYSLIMNEDWIETDGYEFESLIFSKLKDGEKRAYALATAKAYADRVTNVTISEFLEMFGDIYGDFEELEYQ